VYESRADLISRLADVDIALSKVRLAQATETMQGTVTRRGSYAELRKEREEIIKKIELIDARASGGGFINRVQFNKVS